MSWYKRTGISRSPPRVVTGTEIDRRNVPPSRRKFLRVIFISNALRDPGKCFPVSVIALFQIRVVDGRVPGVPGIETDGFRDQSFGKGIRNVCSRPGLFRYGGSFAGAIGKGENPDPSGCPRVAFLVPPQDGSGAGIGEIQLGPRDPDLDAIVFDEEIGKRVVIR